MMKRMLKLMMIALLLLIGLYANDAVASTIDTLIQKMSAGTTKNAVLDVLFFDKTTIWVLIATFFVAVGMVNMASEIGSHFTGASVGGVLATVLLRQFRVLRLGQLQRLLNLVKCLTVIVKPRKMLRAACPRQLWA